MININLKLPERFLDEEERCGHLVTKQTKEIWAIELDILNQFIRVCKKYRLKYYADGGTLLGAIRHGGFIPWDDDIDIAMPRIDYNRFCEIAPSEFQYPYYFQTSKTEKCCYFHFARIRNSLTTAIESERDKSINQGIWIDIFPLDNVPDDTKSLALFQDKLERLQQSLNIVNHFITNFQLDRSKTNKTSN